MHLLSLAAAGSALGAFAVMWGNFGREVGSVKWLKNHRGMLNHAVKNNRDQADAAAEAREAALLLPGRTMGERQKRRREAAEAESARAVRLCKLEELDEKFRCLNEDNIVVLDKAAPVVLEGAALQLNQRLRREEEEAEAQAGEEQSAASALTPAAPARRVVHAFQASGRSESSSASSAVSPHPKWSQTTPANAKQPLHAGTSPPRAQRRQVQRAASSFPQNGGMIQVAASAKPGAAKAKRLAAEANRLIKAFRAAERPESEARAKPVPKPTCAKELRQESNPEGDFLYAEM